MRHGLRGVSLSMSFDTPLFLPGTAERLSWSSFCNENQRPAEQACLTTLAGCLKHCICPMELRRVSPQPYAITPGSLYL